ncbi:hypothetical protein GW7_08760 [Heterocephalus glaber]|uniref:Uncharacterized protein n=1 Tax=Heterocephalus glaber TaxID=10181 RepID=G5B8F6_HETGA|nr:hypothetical protein GW7_08760 [Heterocephalus glaber]
MTLECQQASECEEACDVTDTELALRVLEEVISGTLPGYHDVTDRQHFQSSKGKRMGLHLARKGNLLSRLRTSSLQAVLALLPVPVTYMLDSEYESVKRSGSLRTATSGQSKLKLEKALVGNKKHF